MTALWADLRYALRLLAKTPGFTAVLVLTLALGIGASTTIFSVVHSVLMKPLPYRDPDRLVRVYTEFREPANLHKFWVSPPEYNDLARQCKSCEAVAAVGIGTASFTGGDRPVRVKAGYASANLASTLGVQAALGRFYTAEEAPFGNPTVAVIGWDLWKRAYGGDRGVIGKKVTLDGMPVTIVGVMPAGFAYPASDVEAWVPGGLDPNSTRRGNHWLEVTVRLKRGVTIEAFRGEIASLTAGWTAAVGAEGTPEHHQINKEHHPMVVYPLKGEVVGSLATTLWLLQGAVLFVLLIAIANVTNLLLARAEARTREIAVRHAVGATRGRLVRQLITESLVLGVIGGGLGVLIAVWALDGTVALIPKSAPRVKEISLDGAALAFALVCTIASSLLFGLAPILHTRRTEVHHALKEGSTRASGSRTRLRIRRALVVTEVALAMMLVIGCGLMVKSFMRLQRVDLGFHADHLLTFEVELTTNYDQDHVEPTWRRIEERMRALPGVRGVTLLGGLPPSRPINANDLYFPGRKRPDDARLVWNTDYWQIVGSDAVKTLGLRVVRGRALDQNDVVGAPSVVMVNEAFVRKFFEPGEDPIGQRVSVAPWSDPPPEQRIVGVVADVKQAGLDRPAGTEAFMSMWQLPDITKGGYPRSQYVVVRTTGDPAAMIPSVTQAMAEVDPGLPLDHLRTMDDVLWEAVARPRFLTFLLGAFASIALLLAAIGIYGVMSYTVAQRTHEIGIRVALGAEPRQVRAMVMRQAGAIVALGAAIGLAAAFGLELVLRRTLDTALYGERLRDPLMFVVVTAAVAAAALIATWIPARRATRVAPTVALRAE